MAFPRISEELLKETVAAYLAHDKNQVRTAIALKLARSTLQSRLIAAAQRGYMLDHGMPPAMPGFVVKETSHKTEGGTWVRQTRESGEEFAVPPGHIVKGVSALVDPEGRELAKWIKTREDVDNTLETIRTAVDELKKDLPHIAPVKGPEAANEMLLSQYTVTDLHFGMLAWAEETRGENYELQIAEDLLLKWFSAAIAMAPDSEVGVLAQLGDFMHHDALESVTPAHKHVLDADSRLQKIIRVVIRVVRQIIAMLLQKHRQVHVVMASANHDPASSAWLRELLHVMYDMEPRITIDNSPDVYYAYEWGSTALFYHHGHKRKVSDVDHVFVAKFREMYGRAKQSYGHVGHLHSDEVIDSNLMRVERHRTLAPTDAYASGGGWISKRDAKVITYHKEFGEVSRITLSPQMVKV